jgi:hypothetical protein
VLLKIAFTIPRCVPQAPRAYCGNEGQQQDKQSVHARNQAAAFCGGKQRRRDLITSLPKARGASLSRSALPPTASNSITIVRRTNDGCHRLNPGIRPAISGLLFGDARLLAGGGCNFWMRRPMSRYLPTIPCEVHKHVPA